jgi:hypothetical protein
VTQTAAHPALGDAGEALERASERMTAATQA